MIQTTNVKSLIYDILLSNLSKDFIVAEEVDLLAVDLDGETTILRQEDLVTDSNADREELSLSSSLTRSNSNDLTFVVLGDLRLRQEDATSSLLDTKQTEGGFRAKNILMRTELVLP